MHWSSQAVLSATKPNLPAQNIAHGLGGFFLRSCGDMGMAVTFVTFVELVIPIAFRPFRTLNSRVLSII
jgi:hypothetical protein